MLAYNSADALVLLKGVLERRQNKLYRFCRWKSTQAYVAFRGTLNEEEWADNARGLVEMIPQCNQSAVDSVGALFQCDCYRHSKGIESNQQALFSFVRDGIIYMCNSSCYNCLKII